jgi:hypothetical protein
MPAVPSQVLVLQATTTSDVLLPVVSTSATAGGALFVQVKWGNGTFEWLAPAEYQAVSQDYPLTASDDDEFFDAPAGSVLLIDGEFAATKVDDGYLWQNAVGGDYHQAGEVWAELVPDPFGAAVIKPAVLRVPWAWARSYGLAANYAEAEAEAEARVAAWMKAGTA